MFRAFGDSITVGTGATAGNSWMALFTPVNSGVSGATAATMSGVVQGVTPDPAETYTIMIGTNDAKNYKSDAAKQLCYERFLRNSLTHLSTNGAADCLEVGGVPNPAAPFTGTWASISVNTIGRETTAAGASVTMTVSGTAVYIGYIIQDVTGADSVADVEIDGVVVGQIRCKQPIGSGYAPACERFGGLPAGNHIVKITNTVAGKKLYLNYIKGSDQIDPPKILLSNVIQYSAAGYTSFGITSATIDEYNVIINDLITEVTTDGMNVTLVDNHASINPATDLADNVHPNDAGHAKINANFNALL